jgi:flagellar export protein FliJ
VKAFHFRLDQALRWRETQAGLQKSRVAAAVGRLSEIERSLESERASLNGACSGLLDNPFGHALQSFAAFRDRTRRRIRDLEGQSLLARRNVGLEMNQLVEATRKVRILENLKQADQTRWHRDLDHELAAFADEAFLSRLQLK